MRLAFAVVAFVVPALCQAQEIAPMRAGLVAVPVPALEDLEPVVAEQIRAQRVAFESVTARPNVSDRDLAAAYHAVGRLCHAYEYSRRG
jgi:hypothetical protein